MLFSEQFGVSKTDEDTWFDPVLNVDTWLFIDPFLIYADERGPRPRPGQVRRATVAQTTNHTLKQTAGYDMFLGVCGPAATAAAERGRST